MTVNSSSRIDKAMTTEQFTQIVDAILAGKYSWACVLILRFAGYNPLHYIPYRTYNRLMKENRMAQKQPKPTLNQVNEQSVSRNLIFHQSDKRIRDLSFLEPINEPQANIRGGTCYSWSEYMELDRFLAV